MAQITANGSKGHHKFTLDVVESSYSVSNNTSDVSFTFKIAPRTNGYNWSGWGSYISYTVTIDGTNYTGTIGSYNGSSTVTLKSDSKNGIEHNSDGTKSIGYSFSVTDTSGQSYTCGNASASGTMELTTIPRASSITVADANIGSSTNITINKASSGFTTTLYYKATGQSNYTKIVDKTSNQVYGWEVPTSFYSLIPNNSSIYCEFLAETFNGDTLIGSSTTGATFNVNTYPSVVSTNWYTSDQLTQTLTGNSTTVIKGVSELYIEINANAGTGASLSSYVINGVSSSSNDRTIYNADTDTYNITIYDSRGMEGWGSITTGFVDYIPLTINANVSRNQPTDGKVNISASGNYFNGDFRTSYHNTLTIEYRYKESTSSTWGSWTSFTNTPSNNTYSASTQLSNIDYTKQYDFEIRATDRVGTKQITGLRVSRGIPVYNWDNDEFDVNVDFYNKAIDLFNDTSGTDWKNMLKNKLDYCIANINTSKTDAMAFINGGWQNVNYGFGVFSKVGIVYQLVWHTTYGTYYCIRYDNGTYYYSRTSGTGGSPPPSNNLNDFKDDGKYSYNRGDQYYDNCPTSDGIHILNVYSNGSNDWVIQEDYVLRYGSSTTEKYIRQFGYAGWSNWQRII